IQQKALSATAEIKKEWTDYTVNNKHPHKLMTSVTPLCQSTWDQPSPYNMYCPGGSVTGCVATAMAQIMRYWSYPAMGKGASSYCDCTAGGFTQNYGTLSANYAHPYKWVNMPLNGPTTADTDIGRLMSDCGISVNMDYSPSGSGAWEIKAEDSICAENSY